MSGACGCDGGPCRCRKPAPAGMPPIRAGGRGPIPRAGGDWWDDLGMAIGSAYDATTSAIGGALAQAGAAVGDALCKATPPDVRAAIAKSWVDNQQLFNFPGMSLLVGFIPTIIMDTAYTCDVSKAVQQSCCAQYKNCVIIIAMAPVGSAAAAAIPGIDVAVATTLAIVATVAGVLAPIYKAVCEGHAPTLKDIQAVIAAVAKGASSVGNNGDLLAGLAIATKLSDSAIKAEAAGASTAAATHAAAAQLSSNPAAFAAQAKKDQAAANAATAVKTKQQVNALITIHTNLTAQQQATQTTLRNIAATSTHLLTVAPPTPLASLTTTPAASTSAASLAAPLAAGALGFAFGGPVGALVGAGAAYALSSTTPRAGAFALALPHALALPTLPRVSSTPLATVIPIRPTAAQPMPGMAPHVPVVVIPRATVTDTQTLTPAPAAPVTTQAPVASSPVFVPTAAPQQISVTIQNDTSSPAQGSSMTSSPLVPLAAGALGYFLGGPLAGLGAAAGTFFLSREEASAAAAAAAAAAATPRAGAFDIGATLGGIADAALGTGTTFTTVGTDADGFISGAIPGGSTSSADPNRAANLAAAKAVLAAQSAAGQKIAAAKNLALAKANAAKAGSTLRTTLGGTTISPVMIAGGVGAVGLLWYLSQKKG